MRILGDNMKSQIEFKNGKPFINIDGSLHYPLAYTTYFDECGCWSDFISNGYRMFFVNVSFNDLPINNITGFSPFLKGVFESDVPDYSAFDESLSILLLQEVSILNRSKFISVQDPMQA